MTDKIKDGGPAFPSEQGHTPEHGWNQTYSPGMLLRDWFAGQALGCMTSEGLGELNIGASAECAADEVAKAAYMFADAMLKERDND